MSATLSCSGVITRAAASASCSAIPCCFASATARSNEVCLIIPEAICAAPTVSCRKLDCANRTIPCWKVTARFDCSCCSVSVPVDLLRRSSTKSAPTGRSEIMPSIAGIACEAPVSRESASRSAAGSKGLAKKAAGLIRAANSWGSCL